MSKRDHFIENRYTYLWNGWLLITYAKIRFQSLVVLKKPYNIHRLFANVTYTFCDIMLLEEFV